MYWHRFHVVLVCLADPGHMPRMKAWAVSQVGGVDYMAVVLIIGLRIIFDVLPYACGIYTIAQIIFCFKWGLQP